MINKLSKLKRDSGKQAALQLSLPQGNKSMDHELATVLQEVLESLWKPIPKRDLRETAGLYALIKTA